MTSAFSHQEGGTALNPAFDRVRAAIAREIALRDAGEGPGALVLATDELRAALAALTEAVCADMDAREGEEAACD